MILEIKKSAVSFEENELVELERIILDQDEAAAFQFLRKQVYQKIARSQKDRLKSHLDSGSDPVEKFKSR